MMLRRSGSSARLASCHQLAIISLALFVSLAYAANVYRTLGHLEFPLDDAYIYHQYARNLARGLWFQYVTGDGYTPGSTSVIYPLLLVPAHWARLGIEGLAVYTWVLSATLLAACAWLAIRIGAQVDGARGAWLAAGSLLATGSWTCGVLSGMEIGLYTALLLAGAWLLTRAESLPQEQRGLWKIWIVAALLGLVRPEGVLPAAILITCVQLQTGRERDPVWWLAWMSAFIPFVANGLYNLHAVGHFTPNTAQVKSIFAYPRPSIAALTGEMFLNFVLFWKAQLMTVYVPQLTAFGLLTVVIALAWLVARVRGEWKPRRSSEISSSGPGLQTDPTPDGAGTNNEETALLTHPDVVDGDDATSGRQRRNLLGTYLLLSIGAGIAASCIARVPGNYYRYYHPTLALISMCCGLGLSWFLRSKFSPSHRRRHRRISLVVAFVAGAAGLYQHLLWIDFSSRACAEIAGQQRRMGLWIAENLPEDAVVIANDVGAIAYLGDRRVFDLVGLTTNGQADCFLEGPGAVLERFQRFNAWDRPTHFAVYPEWLNLPFLLGPELLHVESSRPLASVASARAGIYEADWSLLDAGARPPTHIRNDWVFDMLDVGDLSSESEHSYALTVPASERGALFTTFAGVHRDSHGDPVVDGGRQVRVLESFLLGSPASLKGVDEAVLTARLEIRTQATIRVSVDGVLVSRILLKPSPGFSLVDLGKVVLERGETSHRIEVRLEEGDAYRVFCYWLRAGLESAGSPGGAG